MVCLYRIGEFSKICRLTVKTLRYYDQVGLLRPASVDDETGYRYYTSEQLSVTHRILALRQMGLSIQEIQHVQSGACIASMLTSKQRDLEETILHCEEQIARIAHYLKILEEELVMDYEVVLKELPEVIVYSKRMTIPDYDHYFQIIPEIGDEVKKANPTLQCAVPEYCFIIYHDGEYREKDIDVEFCEAVTSFGEDTDSIRFKLMARVPQAACVLHKGSYSTIGKAYSYLYKWISDNGYVAADNPRESYIDGIWNKEDEAEWLTELQIPIK